MTSKSDELLVVSKQIKFPFIVDPLNIVRQQGQSEILLLESADLVTKRSEKSLLFLDLALKIEARDSHITVEALIKEGRPLLKALKNAFKKESSSKTPDIITITIEPIYNYLDLIEKMHARSALDILRHILASIVLDDETLKKYFMLTGAFSYDFLDHFEKLPAAREDRANLPHYIFYLPLTLITIDHRGKKTTITSHGLGEEKSLVTKRLKQAEMLLKQAKSVVIKPLGIPKISNQLSYEVDIPNDQFAKVVEQCKEYIRAGDVYQIVPSRMFSANIKDEILSYQILRQINPSPYMFYLRNSDWVLFGASPETFIKVDQNGKRVFIRPIAGTRRRGFSGQGDIDDELDSREQASLCLDEKELAEHMMLVDLARNDIASIARPQSRRIKRLLAVDRFSHVMHLVSEVTGILNKGLDALSAYQASMNMGTLMGAPKVRAAELLRAIEPSKRGFYGGAVGYIDLLGNMDTAIIIRSALVKNGRTHVRAGCGVVFDSVPEFEVQETINKAEAVLRSIALAGEL